MITIAYDHLQERHLRVHFLYSLAPQLFKYRKEWWWRGVVEAQVCEPIKLIVGGSRTFLKKTFKPTQLSTLPRTVNGYPGEILRAQALVPEAYVC